MDCNCEISHDKSKNCSFWEDSRFGIWQWFKFLQVPKGPDFGHVSTSIKGGSSQFFHHNLLGLPMVELWLTAHLTIQQHHPSRVPNSKVAESRPKIKIKSDLSFFKNEKNGRLGTSHVSGETTLSGTCRPKILWRSRCLKPWIAWGQILNPHI